MYRFLILAILTLAACQMDNGKAVNTEAFNFRVYDDTQIFFKNIRQSSYELEELKEAKLKVFRLKARKINNEIPQIQLAILVNWMKDEAYVLTEPNAFFEDVEIISVDWHDEASDSTGVIIMAQREKTNMLKFSNQIYEAIISGKKLTVTLNGTTFDFLSDPKEREAFRITMADYFRLTRAF